MINRELFDRTRLRCLPLASRKHDMQACSIMHLQPTEAVHYALEETASSLDLARKKNRSRILMMGAHVLRKGCQRYLIDMMEQGYISCISVNGACAIHDYELALIGETTESVAKYISEGQFGLWEETGRLNDVVAEAAKTDCGIGPSIGRAICEGDFPHKDISIFAAAWRMGIPVTVHVGIGYDIVCEHPNYDGAAWGKSSYIDFLVYARHLQNLEGGVVMNFGSAVMAPEIYLKALAMARNVASQEGRSINKFTILVCDLHDLPSEVTEEASKASAAYYFRPWKTMLVRTVADGGKSWYVKGDHAETIPQLWTALTAGRTIYKE